MKSIGFVVGAAVLHELGHILTAKMMGVRVKRVGISWIGPYIVRETGSPLQNAFITLAGPGVNILLGIILWHSVPRFAFYNLVLGVSNLVPFPKSDGARFLQLFTRIPKCVNMVL